MKRIKLLILAGILLFSFGSVALPAGAAALPMEFARALPTDNNGDVPQATSTPSTSSTSSTSSKAVVCSTISDNNNCRGTPSGSLDLNKIITTVINILSSIVGVAAVIMLVYGGFRYITAAGDSGKLNSARSTIIYALVGVAIAALSQGLVKFVLNKATH